MLELVFLGLTRPQGMFGGQPSLPCPCNGLWGRTFYIFIPNRPSHLSTILSYPPTALSPQPSGSDAGFFVCFTLKDTDQRRVSVT